MTSNGARPLAEDNRSGKPPAWVTALKTLEGASHHVVIRDAWPHLSSDEKKRSTPQQRNSARSLNSACAYSLRHQRFG
jgi:hypothetical protein